MTESPDPWIDLRLWRQFVTVADELHFGRSATRLHMTQPPLTQAIAGLERLLGARLFDRTKRSVALTATGAALLPEVRDLLARAQALPGRARAVAAGEVGRLRLVFVSTVGFDLLPQWVSAFRQAWPGVALELIEATGDVQQLLNQGEVDAGFLLHAPGFAPLGLAQLSLSQEPMVLAVPQTHALAASAELTLDAVLAEPLVMFPRRILPSVFDAVCGLYHAAGRWPLAAHRRWRRKRFRCRPS
jgi:DNA-binding transcriptional LysR family regulator